MFKNLWNWFINFFRSNLVILQIGVQEVANMIFKNKPQLKAPTLQAIQIVKDVIAQAPGTALSDAIALAKNKIVAGLPPDQQIILGTAVDQMFASLASDMNNYFNKMNITNLSEQLKVFVQVLDWVGMMAQL